jgi:MSHA biogenesis protein MshL
VSHQPADEQEGWDWMKRILLNGWLVLLAAGCSQPPVKPDLSPAIKELDQAIASKATVPQPDAVSQALLPPIVVEMPKADGKPVEPRFDLSVNNAAASEVFMAIVAGTRYSMIVHPSIKERLSVNLKDVTVREALDTLREMYGYEYKVQGNRIMIEPVAMQTRVFRMNYLLSTRKGRSEIRVSSGAVSDSADQQQAGAVGGTTTPQTTSRALESSRIVTTSDTDIWTDVANAVRTIIGPEGGRNVIVNAQSGIVLVRAMPAELRQVEEFLNAMQGIVARQVMLEAKIIEVQLKDQFATGINWAAFGEHIAAGMLSPGTILSPQGVISAFTARGEDGNLLPNSQILANTAAPGAIQTQTAVPGSVFGLALQTSSFAALLGFLQTQGDLQVLSSPRIATLNNQKAVLKVGNDQFFVTNITNNQTITNGTTQNAPSITLQPFFSGVSLDVTPQIDEAEQIILHIHPSVSRVFNKNTDLDLGTAGTFRLPLASSDIRETDTIVRVGNSNIVAIGGLMTEASDSTNSGMPWLGDVPVLGAAFKNTNRHKLKSELVILIKPTVILNGDSWKEDLEATRQRIQTMEYEPTPNILGVGPGSSKATQAPAKSNTPATSATPAPSGR